MVVQVAGQAGEVGEVEADGEEDTTTMIPMILHRHTILQTQVNSNPDMVPVRDGDQASGPEPLAGLLRVGLLDGWVIVEAIRRALAGVIAVGVDGVTVRVAPDRHLGIASPTRGTRALVLDRHHGDEAPIEHSHIFCWLRMIPV